MGRKMWQPLGELDRLVLAPPADVGERLGAFGEEYTQIATLRDTAVETRYATGDVYEQTVYAYQTADLSRVIVIKFIETEDNYETRELENWNRVRRLKLPGFLSTLGYLLWNRVYTEEEEEEDDEDETVSMGAVSLALEYAPNTLERHSFRLSGADYISLIGETFAILGTARERGCFSHDDIHPGNIAIKQVPARFERIYSFGGATYQFGGGYAPFLLDLEKAAFDAPIVGKSDLYNMATVINDALDDDMQRSIGLWDLPSVIFGRYPGRRGDSCHNVNGVVEILRDPAFARFRLDEGIGCDICIQKKKATHACSDCNRAFMCDVHKLQHTGAECRRKRGNNTAVRIMM